MSKRKPGKASKRAPSPKIAARAQRNKQDIVRSAKDELLRSVAAGPIESPLELHVATRSNSRVSSTIQSHGMMCCSRAASSKRYTRAISLRAIEGISFCVNSL